MSTAEDPTPRGEGPAKEQRAFRPRPPEDRFFVTHWLGEVQYQQANTALYRADAAHPRGERVAPGVLEVPSVVELRDVTRDLAPGEPTDVLFETRYTPAGPESTRTTQVASSEMADRGSEWLDRAGFAARITKRARDHVPEAIRAMGQTLEQAEGWPMGFGSTGLLLRPGQPAAFLRQCGPALTAAGVDPTLTCHLIGGVGSIAGPAALSLDDPATGDELGAGLDLLAGLLDIVPTVRGIGAGLLGQLAWAPVAGIPEAGRPNVILAQESGKAKTALAGVSIAAQSSTFTGGIGVEVPVTVKARHLASSGIGMDLALYPLSGMVGIVDDWFAGKMSGKEIAAGWAALSRLGDNAATGSGGAKTIKGVRLRSDRYPRCSVLATAEDLPDEAEHASEIARYVAFKIPDGEAGVDLAALTALQLGARSLSGAHAAHVVRLLGDLAPVHGAPWRALALAREQAEAWRVPGHRRALEGYVKLLAGLHLFADTLRANDRDGDRFVTEAADALAETAHDQARRCGMTARGSQTARNPVRLFVRHFLGLLRDDRAFYLADHRSKPGAWGPPEIPGHGPGIVGWKQSGQGSVEDHERADGKGFPPRWDPIGGDPLGAVHVYQGRGRTPWRPVMLSLRAKSLEDLYPRITRRALALDGWAMPAYDEMLRALRAADLLESTDTRSINQYGHDPKCLVLDLGEMLDPTTDPDAGPEAATGEVPPVDPTDQLPAAGPVTGETLQAFETPAAAGPRAGEVATTDDPVPCLGCGRPTRVRVAGEPRHAGPECSQDRPTAPSPADPTPVAPAPAPSPTEAPAGVQGPPREVQMDRLARALAGACGDDRELLFPTVTREDLAAMLDLWHTTTDGTWVGEFPGATGVRLHERLGKQHGGSIPLERLSPEGLAALPAKLYRTRVNHLDRREPITPGQYVTAVDVNAQYLAGAAAVSIGDGDPRVIEDPSVEVVAQVVKSERGYLTLAAPLVTGHPVFGTIPAGEVITAPTARYLTRNLGLTLPRMAQAVAWWKGGPRLSTWAATMRRPYIELAGADDLPSRGARYYAKRVHQGFLGGMLRSSRYNKSGSGRRDASDQLVSQVSVNMLRALDKIDPAEARVLGTMNDTAYLLSDDGPVSPAGLTFSGQPGKWKLFRHAEVTPKLAAAFNTGSPRSFSLALATAHRIREAAK